MAPSGKEDASPRPFPGKEKFHLGLDVGSVSADLAVLDEAGRVLHTRYVRTKGRPWEVAAGILEEAARELGVENCATLSLTGSAAQPMTPVLGANFVNEIIAHARSAAAYHPQARTIIDMGGEDSKLILMGSGNGNGGKPSVAGVRRIADFAMNSMCAAGTGSFLDQQARRLGMGIGELGEAALKCGAPPRVAGRCSVFAKTDMIHLQQEATPDRDILAGLCFALARNLKSNIARGKEIAAPVVFQGGVAANLGVRRALREVMGLEDGQLIIPEHFFFMGAIGAALLNLEKANGKPGLAGLEAFLRHVRERRVTAARLAPLKLGTHHLEHGNGIRRLEENEREVPAYLGVDVGSISTNVVVIDGAGRVLSKQYLPTAGRPLEAVKEGIRLAGEEVGGRVGILGAATTGSGRYLTAAFIGADLVRNEITAQAKASAELDPEVDTIFEIGGQDSKYISLEHGVVVDFTMNKICAAGTGSFLEEQAEKLGISIREEFGRLALSSPAPVKMGERCTVFMESDILRHQEQGLPVADIVGGLSYAIVHNYLNKVVENRPVGAKVFYQGATASNPGIVAAFEKVLGRPIQVPPHNEVTGAIGAALLARDQRTWEKSGFKGFGVARESYSIDTFECQGCANRCEVRRVGFRDREHPLFYGSRCDRYEKESVRAAGGPPDLLALRESWLTGEGRPVEVADPSQAVNPSRNVDPSRAVGLPRTMFFRELLPFFRAFLEDLGFQAVVGGPTSKAMVHAGVEKTAAETCFPVKATHGHLLDLAKRGVKRILLPSIVSLPPTSPRLDGVVVCPYAQALPYTCRSALDFRALGVELLQPVLRLGEGPRALFKGMKELARQLGASSRDCRQALCLAREAQEEFQRRCREKGREVLEGLEPGGTAVVLVSRPYNGLDPGLNLGLHHKLRDLGIPALPLDFLDLEAVADLEGVREMYWRYGQRILAAAKIIRNDSRLQALYITNFGCGPDSFILHFFREMMEGRPFLEIEIDEHSAGAGAMTRLEAFLDSLQNARRLSWKTPAPSRARHPAAPAAAPAASLRSRRTIYVPPMSDHALPMAAAFQACGVSAASLPESDQETLALGRRFTSGKECYPCILTTGDMVKFVQSPGFKREEAAFFMPSGQGPCRFGNYHRLHRRILDQLGYPDVPIFAPTQTENIYSEFSELSDEFPRKCWEALSGADVLQKLLLETRPYEVRPGAAQEAYRRGLSRLTGGIRRGESLLKIMEDIKPLFRAVEVRNPGARPLIGMVGEFYTCANRFANQDIVRRLEELGAEVAMPPVTEWVLYVNVISILAARRKGSHREWLRLKLTDHFQRRMERRLGRAMESLLRRPHEPAIRRVLEQARPYIDPSFEGEAGALPGQEPGFP